MEDFIMKPKVDMAFKEIMMDEKPRTGFLSAMLKIRPEDIKEPYNRRRTYGASERDYWV